MRGHDVTVYEKEERLGGRWYLGCQIPHKDHFYDMIEYFRDQAVKHGATIELGREITAREVEALGPDAVIVAAGSSPLIPPIPGADQDFVVTTDGVLAGRAEVGKKVVIVGGGSCGAETADFLAERGVRAIVVEMLESLCPDMLPDAKYFLLERLEKAGVPMLSSTMVASIGDHCVELLRTEPASGLEWTATIEDVDTVILAVGARPNQELAEQLKGLDAEVHAIGDCVQPGFAIDAIYQGARIGADI
jgi:pyruvate/2-oxoglutarate dehydrogenase complex dihydrolipoamide dehydrogenase (E3) component